MKHVRNCPKCDRKIEYKNNKNLLVASNKETICSHCTSSYALSCVKYNLQTEKIPKADLSGKVFNNWEVLNLSHRDDKKSCHGMWYWNVKCINCGVLVKRSTSYIKKSKSCIYCELLPKGETGLNKLLCCYRESAMKRNIIFNLEKDQFRKLTSSSCYYCGCLPEMVKVRKYKNDSCGWGDYTFNGIDRVDNKLGYYIENCVPCCRTCNRGKGAWSFQFWVFHLQRFFENALKGRIKCLEVLLKNTDVQDGKEVKRW